jgi:hypothetical protein
MSQTTCLVACRCAVYLSFHTWRHATSTVRQSESSRHVWKLRLHFYILLLDATWIVRMSYVRCLCVCVANLRLQIIVSEARGHLYNLQQMHEIVWNDYVPFFHFNREHTPSNSCVKSYNIAFEPKLHLFISHDHFFFQVLSNSWPICHTIRRCIF